MTTQFTTAQYGEMSVQFQENGFINATAIAKQFGKRTENYLRADETKAYITALQKYLFLPENSITQKSVIKQNQLVIVKSGAPETGGGTWLHPKLAIHFARWLNADFAVWCDLEIERILYSKDVLTNADLVDFFLKPITEVITEVDFQWRKRILKNAVKNLKKAQVLTTTLVSGKDLF